MRGHNTKTIQSNNSNIALNMIYVFFISALTVICYKLFYRMCTSDTYESDFIWYINLPTAEYKERYRLLGWLFDLMYRHGIRTQGMVVYLAIVIAGIILVSYLYLNFFSTASENGNILKMLSLCATFMGPIFVPFFHPYYYRWSFPTFAWHSPTEQSMVLYSMIAVLCFIKMYEKSENGVSLKWWLLTMLSVLLSAFAKPAFAIDLILAMIALFIIDLFISDGENLGKKLKKRILMGISLIPTGIYMLIVMKYDFHGGNSMHEGSVVIDIQHVLDYPNLTAAIVTGLAFPAVVWITNIHLLREKRYKTVFAVFLMGLAQWMFLYEQGERATHGNFNWGRQIGSYLFFLTSVTIAINNWRNTDEFMADRQLTRKIYFAVISILFVLHVSSQLRYFYLICMGHSYFI